MLEQVGVTAERKIKINLTRYINRSAMMIPQTFSLQRYNFNQSLYQILFSYICKITFFYVRTYTLVRVLGLRHLTVVDGKCQVIGIVTRKDLMESSLIDRLKV